MFESTSFDEDGTRESGALSIKTLLASTPFGALPSEAQMEADSQAFTMAIARALMGPQERQILLARMEFGDNMIGAALAAHLNISHTNVRTIESNIRKKLKRVFTALEAEEGHDFLARDVLLWRFLPELLRDKKERPVQFKKLTQAGIIFTDDGRVDLSGSSNNQFYTTVFKTAETTFISGIDLLEARSRTRKSKTTVADLFKGKNVSDDLVIAPEEEAYVDEKKGRKGTLTPEDILAAVRDPINIAAMRERFHFRLNDKGKWLVFATNATFYSQWCHFNGDIRGGQGLLYRLGLPISQAGMKQFFETIVGAENLEFIESEFGATTLPIENLGEKGVFAELHSKRNQALLESAGIVADDKECKIYAHTTYALRDEGLKVFVCNRLVSLTHILQGLGFAINRVGLQEFCAKLYPDCTVKDKVGANGHVIFDESDRPAILLQVKRPENQEKLKNFALQHNGKLSVEIPIETIRTAEYSFFEGTIKILALMEYLGIEGSWPQKIRDFYAMIFGEEVLMTDEDLNTYRREELRAKIATPENLARLEALVEKDDDKLKVNLSSTDIIGVRLNIEGEGEKALRPGILHRLGFGSSAEDIAQFYITIFGAERITLPEKVARITTMDQLALAMQEPANQSALAAFCSRTSKGRLFASFEMIEIRKERFSINGSSYNLAGIFQYLLGTGYKKELLDELYRKVFGAENYAAYLSDLDTEELIAAAKTSGNAKKVRTTLNGIDLNDVRKELFVDCDLIVHGKTRSLTGVLQLIRTPSNIAIAWFCRQILDAETTEPFNEITSAAA